MARVSDREQAQRHGCAVCDSGIKFARVISCSGSSITVLLGVCGYLTDTRVRSVECHGQPGIVTLAK